MNDKALQLKEQKEPTLKQMVLAETKNREIITQFIGQHMKEGVDYGSIVIGGKTSKPSLFKAGAEKFGSLMKLRPDVVKDNDTWEMSGSKPGLFCYRCNLYNMKGELVGMGLGACTLEEKKSYNNAIKIAKKRAFVDAIMTTGALSDFFTQDLEDMDTHSQQTAVKTSYTASRQGYQVNPTPKHEPIPEQMITTDDSVRIRQLQSQKGISQDKMEDAIEYLSKGKKSLISQLTHKEAEKIIIKLETLPDKKGDLKAAVPSNRVTEEDLETIHQATSLPN